MGESICANLWVRCFYTLHSSNENTLIMIQQRALKTWMFSTPSAIRYICVLSYIIALRHFLNKIYSLFQDPALHDLSVAPHLRLFVTRHIYICQLRKMQTEYRSRRFTISSELPKKVVNTVFQFLRWASVRLMSAKQSSVSAITSLSFAWRTRGIKASSRTYYRILWRAPLSSFRFWM